MTTTNDHFNGDTTGLPSAGVTTVAELASGDRFPLSVEPVTKTVAGSQVKMLAYNGSVPGPTLKVREGSQIVVDVENRGDLETTVHWHGLRLDNKYDGTDLTQHPIPVGASHRSVVAFPDPGVYWYHPHIRTDYGLEMGLYGGVIVEPADPTYWPACHRQLLITLDDVLIEDGAIAPFSRTTPTHAAMGRFGNVMLVNGRDDCRVNASPEEVVRIYFVNTANTRVFRVGIPGAAMKLVGGDSGRVEHETFVDDVTLGPSERAAVDVRFPDTAGVLTLEHRTPNKTYSLATINVAGDLAVPDLSAEFDRLRHNPDMAALRSLVDQFVDVAPDKSLVLTAVMDFPVPEGADSVVYACPMHPEVVSETEGHCPKCAMRLLPVSAQETSYSCPMHPDVVSPSPGHCPKCAMKLLPTALIAQAADHGRGGTHDTTGHAHGHSDDHGHSDGPGNAEGIEWEDDMVEVNRISRRENMQWKLVDVESGAENKAIDWRFRVGDKVKIRLINEMAGDHPMHHPFHIHAAGRFLVLARDDVVEPNLVWKDTVLLRTGETVDILLDVSTPGHWMAHCHIAEHHENGMMFNFWVDD